MPINLHSLLIFFLVLYGIASSHLKHRPPSPGLGYLTQPQFLSQIPSQRKE